jgi:site-specific DNA-cytosine methylase
MKTSFTAIGCYIFAGGFTIGMSKHLKILAHFEETHFGVSTFKKNFKIPVYVGIENWPIKLFTKKVDVIYGNPPCAAWSAVGKSMKNGKDNWKTDNRVQCTRNLFKLIKQLKPKIWVWESVPRAHTSGRVFVDELAKQALKLGYAVTYLFTNAQYHGLPQRRIRFHMIIHNIEIKFENPSMKRMTVEDAISKLKNDWYPRRTTKDLKLIKNTKQGGSLYDTFNKIMPKVLNKRKQVIGRPIFMNFRLKNNEVSPTLIGGCHAVHPIKNRFITPIEHAVLCGYPENYKWDGPPQSWYKLSGQTVTPVIGDYLGKTFKKALRKNISIKPNINLINHRKGGFEG